MKKIYLAGPDSPGTIAPELYGHFSEHIGGVFYDGLWVGKDSKIPNEKGFRKALIDAFRKIDPPVLRWPGGCFAETYSWRDGIGPDRPTRINWWHNHDGRMESNEVGTHEFCEFCEAAGAKPYFAANVTSNTPLEIRNWMDYCLSPRGSTTLAKEREANGRPEPFNVPFWGVGNENWGGGGMMTADHYADVFRSYATVMRNTCPDVKLFAGGPNADDYLWTREFLQNLERYRRYHEGSHLMDGLSMHYYCGEAGDPVAFREEEWYQMLRQANRMEEILTRHSATLCSYGWKNVKLVIDEWGCWHPAGSGPSKGKNLFEQQSTLRDAAVTALTLNIFNNHCDKIQMANCAQLVNNLHCLFLAAGENFIVTPTWHVFRMYRAHQGARAIRTFTEGSCAFEESVSVSASEKDGKTLVTLANLSADRDAEIELVPVGFSFRGKAEGELLTGKDLHAHNTFEEPDAVRTVSLSAANGRLVLPAGGIAALRFESGKEA